MTTNFDPQIGQATRWKKGQASLNPGGRPKTRVLSEALRGKLAEVKPDDPEGRTYAEVVAANLIDIACSRGPGAVAAMGEIADRVEGRSRQEIAINDITRELREKSDEELRFYVEHDRWPNDDELATLGSKQDGVSAVGQESLWGERTWEQFRVIRGATQFLCQNRRTCASVRSGRCSRTKRFRGPDLR